MYTFTSESRPIFGFNFRNSVEHMACSFRVDPLFNCTFCSCVLSALLFVLYIPVFLVEIPFSFLPFSLPSVSAPCSYLHPYLLPVSAILSTNPTLSRLLSCSYLLVCASRKLYLCHTLSPKLNICLYALLGIREKRSRVSKDLKDILVIFLIQKKKKKIKWESGFIFKSELMVIIRFGLSTTLLVLRLLLQY